MMTFDRVLQELVGICETDPGFDGGTSLIERACVVRDPQGRVRLVLAPSRGCGEIDLETLKSRLVRKLSDALGGFMAPPILTTRDTEAAGKIARAILEKAEPWDGAIHEDRVSGRSIQVAPGRWGLLERRISKKGWLDIGMAKEPWPLESGCPVVTFYSFKGGVGRTTTLVACAMLLAEQDPPSRIALVDLDLEAPGLGPLLGVTTTRGVLDVIVDHLATGRIVLDSAVSAPDVLAPEVARNVDVLPAGRLDHGFLEKLSRLDFSSVGPWGDASTVPVHEALRRLLAAIRKELKPDYIFIDARAGLHDLAGLSLHGLAHVDVLVTRASEQAYQGLDMTVRTLARRRTEEELRSVVVHGFAPPDELSVEGNAEIIEVRQRAYESFSEYLYARSEDAPQEVDTQAAHYPWRLRRNPLLERFTNLRGVLEQLRTDQYRALVARIVELCAPEDRPDDEDET